MKLTKPILCTAMAGTMLFAAGKASAVMGTITISGSASYQDYNSKTDAPIIKKHSINQKLVLQLLALATGDASITNKPTKLLYDPDAFNENAFDSNEGYYFYGQFYYSNSVAGLVQLDGIDIFGDYYSYIELDSYVDWDFPPIDDNLGFANDSYLEFNYAAAEPSSGNKISLVGNALLYIHYNPYDYDLEAGDMYFANEEEGIYNIYALVIHGPISFNAAEKGSTETESLNLKGSGDGLWYSSDTGYLPLVVTGSAKFSGKGAF